MYYKFLFLLLFLLSWGLQAQNDSTKASNPMQPGTDRPAMDTNSDDVDPWEDEEPKRFQLLYSRGFLLDATALDSVPLNAFGSGTHSLQGGFKIHLFRNYAAVRISPGVTWLRYSYNQNDLKTYPTVPDSLPFTLERERHQLFYLEVPVSLVINITKDEDGDSEFFIEGGGYFGYLMGGSYKQRYTDANGLEVVYTERGLPGLEDEWQRLRYGVFGRVGYKWAALYYNLRFSPVLDELTNASRRPVDSDAYRNPNFPTMQLGISILL